MQKQVLSCFVLSAVLSLTLSAQVASPAPAIDPTLVTDKITVAAAANVATVGDALKTAFTATYPKASVDFVFGGQSSASLVSVGRKISKVSVI